MSKRGRESEQLRTDELNKIEDEKKRKKIKDKQKKDEAKEKAEKEKKAELEKLNYFVENKLFPLTSDKLQLRVDMHHRGYINNSRLKKSHPSLTEILNLVMPQDLWDLIAEKVNNNYARAAKGTTNVEFTKKFHDVPELKLLFSTHMLVENISKEHGMNLTKAYKEKIPKEYRVWGENRFVFLHSNFGTSDLEEITTKFSKIQLEIVVPGDVLPGDEATYAYEPSQSVMNFWKSVKGWEIPHVYCVRKPHPNCLWDDILCTYMEHSGLPFT